MTAKRDANFLNLFVNVTKTITSSLDPDDVFRLITEKIPEIIGVDAATIRLLDKSGTKLELRAAHGLSEAYLNRGTIDTEEPIFKALHGEPIAIDDAPQDPRINFPDATRAEGIQTILVVPIPIRGEIKGVLRLLTKKPHTYQQDEIDLATYYVKEGEPVVIRNAAQDIHTIYHQEAQAEGIGSILAVPITVQGEIIGILRLLTEEVRQFSPADINFAMTVAEQGGVAIQRALDYRKFS